MRTATFINSASLVCVPCKNYVHNILELTAINNLHSMCQMDERLQVHLCLQCARILVFMLQKKKKLLFTHSQKVAGLLGTVKAPAKNLKA